MRNALMAVGVFFILVALAGTGIAQTRTGGNTGGGGAAGPAPAPDLDLPVEKPEIPARPEEEEDKPDEEEPPTLFDEDIPATESITYVIDCSGSMGYTYTTFVGPDGSSRSGTLLDRAKFEVTKSINALSRNFTFNAIDYDCANGSLWSAPREATEENKSQARAWVMGLTPRGATGTGGAVVRGLQGERDSLVLLTDGGPNCNPDANWWAGESDFEVHKTFILSNNPNRVKISCIGIGDYGPFAKFLMEIAGATGGTYIHID